MKKLMTIVGASLLALTTTLVGCKRDGGAPENKRQTSQTEAKDLLIEEIFYFGNFHIGRTPYEVQTNKPAGWKEGGATHYNKYIKVTNPTSKKLSLDGMGLAISQYNPDDKPEFATSIPKSIYTDSLAVSKLYLFPKGNPKNLLKPGESRIIATAALNPVEKERKRAEGDWEESELDFSALLDLTGADYELNDENDKVPTLVPFYDFSGFADGDFKGEYFSVFNITPATGIALVRLGAPSEEILQAIKKVNPQDKKTDKKGKYTRPISYSKAHSNYSEIPWAFFIPNEWITDFVVICAKDTNKWIINAKLDKSFKSINMKGEEAANNKYDLWGKYAGKSMVRKNDGKKLVDTNDSNLDFEVKDASLYKKK